MIKKIKKFFMAILNILGKITKPIGIVVNFILLSIVYFIVIGIVALIAKIMKKDFLSLSLEEKNTYWQDVEQDKKELKYYYRQF